MSRKFAEKVVWITGGGSGLGQEMAKEFAREGATVVVSGRRKESLQETCDAVRALGANAHAVACDVRDEKDRKSTRLNSSHVAISYAVFCLKKKIRRNQCGA